MPETKRVEFIESYIKIGNGDYKWHDNHGELIRCKYCKYYKDGTGMCALYHAHGCAETWYCADGERREDDA
jgi:hypothetical protein